MTKIEVVCLNDVRCQCSDIGHRLNKGSLLEMGSGISFATLVMITTEAFYHIHVEFWWFGSKCARARGFMF